MKPGFHEYVGQMPSLKDTGVFHEHLVGGDPSQEAISNQKWERFTHNGVVYQLSGHVEYLTSDEHEVVNNWPDRSQAVNHFVTIVRRP